MIISREGHRQVVIRSCSRSSVLAFSPGARLDERRIAYLACQTLLISARDVKVGHSLFWSTSPALRVDRKKSLAGIRWSWICRLRLNNIFARKVQLFFADDCNPYSRQKIYYSFKHFSEKFVSPDLKWIAPGLCLSDVSSIYSYHLDVLVFCRVMVLGSFLCSHTQHSKNCCALYFELKNFRSNLQKCKFASSTM